MSWLLIKKGLMKTLVWLKSNWYYPLAGAVILVAFLFFRGKSQALIDAWEQNRKGYRKQMKKIDEIHENQISERNKHLEKKKRKVEELEKGHEERLEKIEEKKEDLIEDLKEGDLASELDKEFDL